MTITTRHCLIAAAMMHVEGYFSTNSLAFRNNNPGNINVHKGQKFGSKIEGFNALVKDVAANSGEFLMHFIYKYAPATENNADLYVRVVSELTGISPTEKI